MSQKVYDRLPSYRKILHYMGMSSLNLVQRFVLSLEREGRIERSRLGRIDVPNQLKPSETTLVPLIGQIACGEPCFEVENIEESFALPRSVFGNGELYMLRAFGDSMIDAGINKDDLLVIRKQDYAADGDTNIRKYDLLIRMKKQEAINKEFFGNECDEVRRLYI